MLQRVSFSLVLLTLGVGSLTTTSAQEARVLRVLPEGPAPSALVAEPTVIRLTYDVQTGEFRDRHVVAPGAIGLGQACFDNGDLGPCGVQDHTPWTIGNTPGEELLDWGVKTCNGSGLVQSLTIAYRTTELDPADGGPGATLSFGLYRGTLGWNRVGTEIFRRTFTGLPGQRAPNGDTHSAPFVYLTIDFGSQPLPLPDGPIGWGYMLLDNESTIATGALLVKAPNPVTSVVDALDVFSPGPASTGIYVGTFNFGSTCNLPPNCCPDASTWLQITEAPLGSTVMNGSGVNPVLFSELLPARVGQAWVTNFDLTAHAGTRRTLILVSGTSLTPPITLPRGEVLIGLGGGNAPSVSSGSLHVLAIPNTPALVGMTFYAQGLLIRPTGMVLTNALEVPVTF